jgi:thiosulfate dehydrogenase (quinone) large subunit
MTSLPLSTPAAVLSGRGARGAAAVRILFGLLWLIDAVFKWMPGFVDGQTLPDELGGADKVQVPVEHQWLQVWNTIGLANPSLFAHAIAVVETVVALLVILGLFTRVALIAATLLALGIWTGAEGMHLPWFTPGQTDLGPSVGYILAGLGLLFASPARVWSLDAVIRRRRQR